MVITVSMIHYGVLTDIFEIAAKSAPTESKLHRRWNVVPPLASDDLILAIWRSSDAHSANSIVIQTHSSRRFTLPWISSAYAGADLGRRSSIRLGKFRNRPFGAATYTLIEVLARQGGKPGARAAGGKGGPRR